MVSIFNNREAPDDLARPQHMAADRLHNSQQALTGSVGVVRARSPRLAESDPAHLHQAALYRPFETRVPFNPVDQEDTIARGSGTVEPCLKTFRRGPERNDIERTHNRTTDRTFRDAIVFENAPLSLGGRTTMAAHSRKDEGMDTVFKKVTDGRSHNLRDV